MILRRFMEHVKEQNWFAVGLDVIVVIVGIFLGMQVTEWNQQRLDRQLESDYLQRLEADIKKDISQINYAIKVQDGRQKLAGTLLESITNIQIVHENPGQFITAIMVAGYTLMPEINDDTFEELKSSGRLPLITDQGLRADISEYYNLISQSAQWDYLRELYQTEYIKRSAGILTAEQHRQIADDFPAIGEFSLKEALEVHARLLEKQELIDWLPLGETGYHRADILERHRSEACKLLININSLNEPDCQ